MIPFAMNASSILITGGAGFLGWNLINRLSKHHRVIGTFHRSEPDSSQAATWIRLPLESTNFPEALKPHTPSAIIHCAAVSNVAACAADEKRAFALNVDATRRLAEFAAKENIPFVFISTDLVFDGVKGGYTEEDAVHPTSYYAETKCLAEELVKATGGRHYILRTALMYGEHENKPGSFLRWTVDVFRRNEALRLYGNQFRNPLYAPDVAAVLEQLLERKSPSGIYHLGGPERFPRTEIGVYIARAFGFSGDIIIETLLMRAPELMSTDDTTLVTDKVRSAIGMIFTTLQSGLETVAEQCRTARGSTRKS